MKSYFLLLNVAAFLWLTFGQLYAQQPIIISVFNESTTIPFTTFINSPLHPGVQVGTEFEGRLKNHLRLYPSISLGYVFHKKLYQGLYANAEIGLDYKSGFGLNIKTKLGFGYLHTFTTQQEYQFNGSNYVSKADRGNARIMPSFTIGFGYDLQKNNPKSTEVFFLYQSWIEYPYSPGFIPLMAHTNIHLGTKFYPYNAR
jgi:hypothetical protein